MIEQTPLVVTTWDYHEPPNGLSKEEEVLSAVSLEVMKKSAPAKKGIAFRFTCLFKSERQPILTFITEDSYVIDLEDKVDKDELRSMMRNSFNKCKEAYDFRKLTTVLHHHAIGYFNENDLDLDPIMRLLE